MFAFFSCPSLTPLSPLDRSFSVGWWGCLFLTGLSIGLVASSKWVGLFSMASVGLYTLWDLFCLWKDKNASEFLIVKHFMARALCLIAVPCLVYMCVFYVHFRVLNSSGPGDAQMSSLFQASLKNSAIANSPLNVVYGSKVSLKSRIINGGLLHSHVQRYPLGSHQQQVTVYHHRDSNNHWVIEKPHGAFKDALENVMDGDLIRLVHEATSANLHSHKIPGSISVSDYEVSGYGNRDKHVDENDHWRIEFVGQKVAKNASANNGLQTLFTVFRLKNVRQNCYLRCTSKVYPDWGFSQGEITCTKNLRMTKDTQWNIEEHMNPDCTAVYLIWFTFNFHKT